MALQKTTKKPCSGTDPEVARVGLNEQDAKRQGVAVEVTRFDLDDLDRALADEEGRGFVKNAHAPGKDKILGATIAAGTTARRRLRKPP